MTRDDLIEYAGIYVHNSKLPFYKEQVYGCKCWLLKKDFTSTIVVQSYNTLAGVYSKETGTLYLFDYYSNTTNKQFRKVAELVHADRIVYLYKRPDKAIEYDCNTGKLWKLSDADWNKLLECDFSSYIENKAFR